MILSDFLDHFFVLFSPKQVYPLVGSLCCVGARDVAVLGRAGLGWAWVLGGRAVLAVLGWVGRGFWLLRFCVIVAEINVIVFCSLSTFRHHYEAFSIAINKKTKERPIMNSKSLWAQLYTVTVSLVFFWCLLDFFLLLRKHAAARGAGQTINAQLHINSWKNTHVINTWAFDIHHWPLGGFHQFWKQNAGIDFINLIMPSAGADRGTFLIATTMFYSELFATRSGLNWTTSIDWCCVCRAFWSFLQICIKKRLWPELCIIFCAFKFDILLTVLMNLEKWQW